MGFYSTSDSKFTRHYYEEVKMTFSAIDCVLHRGHVIYGSSELTTGFRLYEALHNLNLKTRDELKRQMGESWYQTQIFDTNVRLAIEFAEAVRSTLRDNTIVITPAPFTAPGWSQPEYLAFWEELLRTRIKSVWFNRNWQFSNGCAFEFAVAQDAGLPTFDHSGQVLTRESGIHLISAAIQQLEQWGLDASTLRKNLEFVPADSTPIREASTV
ncbi:MAG TPA: hypothetical protein VK776_29400 [Bryobacteraceae bacterium]|jgi:hypothetical protein|nr:hypothetical protein [Bryobacteraceae bacterium]